MTKRRKVNEVTTPCVTEDDDKYMTLEWGLLPGILNEITLEHITTKISWRTIEVLSRVNHAWKQAIKDHLIYNTRIRRHSTETVHVKDCESWDPPDFAPWEPPYFRLWTRADDQREIPRALGTAGNHSVTLDGKVYRMGGCTTITLRSTDVWSTYASRELYVLDLAGCSKRWEMCAPTQAARTYFYFGVQDGKIYIVGGRNCRKVVNTAEVYNANMNTWSSTPLSSIRWDDYDAIRSLDL